MKPKNELMESQPDVNVQALIAYAEGRIDHARNGLCPDEIEGHEARDPDCPVCRALDGKQQHSIEGVIRFLRSDPAEQACVCCPPGGGHIFRRYIEWNEWETGYAEHFGRGPDVLVMHHATGLNENEGKRVRVTVEVLETDQDEAPQALTTYSFRAECQEDVKRFAAACAQARIAFSMTDEACQSLGPDLAIQLDSAAPLVQLQAVLRQVPDGHVMLQTLRACALSQNSLKRDYDIQ